MFTNEQTDHVSSFELRWMGSCSHPYIKLCMVFRSNEEYLIKTISFQWVTQEIKIAIKEISEKFHPSDLCTRGNNIELYTCKENKLSWFCTRRSRQLHHVPAINTTECTKSSKYLQCKVLCKIINRLICCHSKQPYLNQ